MDNDNKNSVDSEDKPSCSMIGLPRLVKGRLTTSGAALTPSTSDFLTIEKRIQPESSQGKLSYKRPLHAVEGGTA